MSASPRMRDVQTEALPLVGRRERRLAVSGIIRHFI